MPAGVSVTPADTARNPATITVKDVAGVPEHITTSTLILHSHCAMTTVTGVTVTPASFTLHAGETAHVIARVPEGHSADYGILFSAHPLHPQPGVNIALGAVGAQIQTGTATDCAGPKALPASHSLINPLGAVILAVIVLGLALATWAGYLYRRRNRRHSYDAPIPPFSDGQPNKWASHDKTGRHAR